MDMLEYYFQKLLQVLKKELRGDFGEAVGMMMYSEEELVAEQLKNNMDSLMDDNVQLSNMLAHNNQQVNWEGIIYFQFILR